MQRRRVLAALAALPAGATLSGCLESEEQQTPDPYAFSTCSKQIIDVETLPDPAHDEVTTALAEGYYESDDELYLPHVMDVDESYLQDGRYYEAVVSERGSTNRLELHETIPNNGHAGFSVESDLSEPTTVTVRVERLDGEQLLIEETVSLDPGDSTRIGSFDRLFGKYSATVESGTRTDSLVWEENEPKGILQGVVLTEEAVEPRPRPTAELIDCSAVWE